KLFDSAEIEFRWTVVSLEFEHTLKAELGKFQISLFVVVQCFVEGFAPRLCVFRLIRKSQQLVHLHETHKAFQLKLAELSRHESISDFGFGCPTDQAIRAEMLVQAFEPGSEVYAFTESGVIDLFLAAEVPDVRNSCMQADACAQQASAHRRL